MKINKIFKKNLNLIYNSNKPYPHINVKNFFVDKEIIIKANNEFLNFDNWDGEKNFYGSVGKRWCSTYKKFPKNTKRIIDFLNSKKFIKQIERLTGIKNLIADNTYFEGGGMHQTIKGGFLKVHSDFNYHERLKLYRRLNILLYISENWKKKYLGQLKLYDEKKVSKVSIKPIFNSACIFNTTDSSFHGYPEPIKNPISFPRNSIALYYYTRLPSDNFGERGKNLNTNYISVNKNENLENERLKNYLRDIFFHPLTFLKKIKKFILYGYRS